MKVRQNFELHLISDNYLFQLQADYLITNQILKYTANVTVSHVGLIKL